MKSLKEDTYNIMTLCNEYRDLELQLRKYSPTKLRQLDVKLKVLNKYKEKEK